VTIIEPVPSPRGSWLNSLIAPPIEFLPASVPCGTAQDLDAVEVHQLEQRARQRRNEHVVDVDADARIERVVEVGLADAADVRDQAGAAVLRLRRERHVRRLRGDFGDVGLAARLEHLGVDRGDRDRRVLQVLLAELRGDGDDVVPPLLVRRGAASAGAGWFWA
jgi:hypothetical protein